MSIELIKNLNSLGWVKRGKFKTKFPLEFYLIIVHIKIKKYGETSVIEEFNGVVFLVIYLIIFIGTAYYTYSTVFQTDAFLKKYKIDPSGAFMVRFAGTFLIPIVLLMFYMLITGISGNWIIFSYGFLQAITASIIGFWTVERSEYKNLDGEKISSEGYLAPIGFAVAWGILMYGTSGNIYG